MAACSAGPSRAAAAAGAWQEQKSDGGEAVEADLSSFLGRVQQELIRLPEAPPSSLVELTIVRDAALSIRQLGSCLSVGRVKVGAAIRGATQGTSLDLRRGFDYRWSARPLEAPPPRRAGAGDGDAEPRTEGGIEALVDGRSRSLRLSVPLPLGGSLGGLADVLVAWAGAATRALAGAAAVLPPLEQLRPLAPLAFSALAGPLLQAVPTAMLGFTTSGAAALLLPGSSLPLLASGVADAGVGGELATHVGIFSLTSAVMFIMSIRGLNKHSTSRDGNLIGIAATALGILSVLASPAFNGAHLRFLLAFLAAGAVGGNVACQVSMEEMPQLVAGFHSFVGLAAVFAGFACYFNPDPFHSMKAFETVVGTAVGMLTFTGSVVAAGKLHGIIPGSPIILDSRWKLNFAGIGGSLLLSGLFMHPSIYEGSYGVAALLGNTALWGALGANMVLPIGGADMPVVISLLNAFSGLATSAMGFMLSNNLLTITGALVASSGTLLSDIMCRGINRPMTNVLLGGFGTEDGSVAGGATAAAGTVNEVSAVGFRDVLLSAKRVVIVPGYGLAVARCQQRLAEIVALLRNHDVTVHFAIHPVAGRLPGHMHVLLAEADVPYDIVKEMEDVKDDLRNYDVAIVVGANDIVNPATQDDPSSPIYGMPCIEVWECGTCVVLKRSMATGYSGVDNPLFYRDNVRMLFGDAKQSLDTMFSLLQDSQNRIQGGGSAREPAGQGRGRRTSRDSRGLEYPEASKVVGVIRERRPGEHRVSISPSVLPALRSMGFSVLLEAGAGVAAGFADDEYLCYGEVRVAESAGEVLQQADVILKVNEPLLDEVQVLKNTQTMIAFWSMYESQELLEVLGQSQASFVNLSLVPRISRAQKMDALTSMANIAGYKAVLDAFNRLPRFSKPAVTASGAVPAARVFVIGAAVAGLSAIATAHALGARVSANDVREAAREQVQSLGADFIPIEAAGIAGEGTGGYADVMSASFQRAQLDTYARVLPEMDVVVATAAIPNRAAPVLIPAEVVRSMKRGAVIVDLAAASGGNCALTRRDQVVVSPNGVTIIGETNYPATMAAQASEMIGNNFAALLESLGGAGDFGGLHWEDAVIQFATVVHKGRVLWHPPSPRPPPSEPAASPDAHSEVAEPLAEPEVQPPQESSWVMQWLKDHQHELVLALGAATVGGLGLGVDIPEAELTHLGYFVFSLLIGHFTVASVTPALHTPLIAVTNAISGIIIVGGMLQLSGPVLSARVACALAAVFLSSINIVGGFAVTQRMLEMFRDDTGRR